MRDHVREARTAGLKIGCVPTMGALHAGHLSLVEEARATCDYVVVTIFINPTQFGPHEDLARYPKPLDRDLELCAAAGVDLVFNPTADTIYPNENAAFVEVPKFSEVLEGAHRPGHFRGVTTVVLKLLNMVQPDVAYFGQKDYQQQLMIRRMVSDLEFAGRNSGVRYGAGIRWARVEQSQRVLVGFRKRHRFRDFCGVADGSRIDSEGDVCSDRQATDAKSS